MNNAFFGLLFFLFFAYGDALFFDQEYTILFSSCSGDCNACLDGNYFMRSTDFNKQYYSQLDANAVFLKIADYNGLDVNDFMTLHTNQEATGDKNFTGLVSLNKINNLQGERFTLNGFDGTPNWWTTYAGDPNVYLGDTVGVIYGPSIHLSRELSHIILDNNGTGSTTITTQSTNTDDIITIPKGTATLAFTNLAQTFTVDHTFSSTPLFTNTTNGLTIQNTSPLLLFDDTTLSAEDWQIGQKTNNFFSIFNSTDSRYDLDISQDGNIFLTNSNKKTTIRGDTNAIANLNIESTLTVKSKTPFNGTLQYTNGVSTCKADYNSGILMQKRGVGC